MDDPNSKRRLRTNFTEYQSSYLEEAFRNSHYPDPSTKKTMSITLGIPEDRLTVWFQNRRAKWRRKEVRERERKQKLKSPSKEKAPISMDSNNLSNSTAEYFKTDTMVYSSVSNQVEVPVYGPRQVCSQATDNSYAMSNMLPSMNNYSQAPSTDNCTNMFFVYQNGMY